MSRYPVASIFRSLQGEGHFVGYPMTFVRLAGCSVAGCSIRRECDEAPWKASARFGADELVEQCRLLAPDGIVCITGGEPTDHDLLPLVSGLRDAGYRIHLETSGVRSLAGMPLDWLTVSPKTADYVQREGHTLKVVFRPGLTWRHVMDLDKGTSFFHRYLQPLTRQDGSTNIEDVISMLMRFGCGRWALSTQAHKAWGVP